jgi:hypothetical protein
MPGRFGKHWDEYREKVIPGAGPQQVHDMELAFYAGGLSLFHEMTTMVEGGTEPTAGDLAKMDEISAELREHSEAAIREIHRAAATSAPTREYPGLEMHLRKAFERARDGLPPDIDVALMFSFHRTPMGGGLAWLAGIHRDSAISIVVEWLERQAREGRQDVIMAAFNQFFGKGGT